MGLSSCSHNRSTTWSRIKKKTYKIHFPKFWNTLSSPKVQKVEESNVIKCFIVRGLWRQCAKEQCAKKEEIVVKSIETPAPRDDVWILEVGISAFKFHLSSHQPPPQSSRGICRFWPQQRGEWRVCIAESKMLTHQFCCTLYWYPDSSYTPWIYCTVTSLYYSFLSGELNDNESIRTHIFVVIAVTWGMGVAEWTSIGIGFGVGSPSLDDY